MNTRLLALRTGRKLSQTAIARSLNCSQRMYSRYERGEGDMPRSILVEAASYYNISADYLLNLTDLHNAYPPKKR